MEDALFRPGVHQISTSTSHSIAKAQKDNKELMYHRSSLSLFQVLKDLSLPVTDGLLVCDISTGKPQPFVPFSTGHLIFTNVHPKSHPGVCAFIKPISDRYVWTCMSRNICNGIRTKFGLPCSEIMMCRVNSFK